MKQNRSIKAFRFGVDKFPNWMSFYVENRRFIPQADCRGSWAIIQNKQHKSVVREGDWVVETNYKLSRLTHDEFTDLYEAI